MLLAHTIGITPHLSSLLRKAKQLGYPRADDLLRLAVSRGCAHYAPPDWDANTFTDCGRELFSNDELAIALISPSLDGSMHPIRCAAQLLRAPDIEAGNIVRLARMERSLSILHYIAISGSTYDHEGRFFWQKLLDLIPETTEIPPGRLPHPSRFVSQPGWSPRSRPVRRPVWLKPL